ncbi:hypothetical protein [Burkholderia gladioli]|uniref:hypothetical protein n=1 Tax=Burkholderia gladioli TaxID=28095 RepID=UPI001FC8C661|nr:hypothetical protein [Burkholderia gladioli]
MSASSTARPRLVRHWSVQSMRPLCGSSCQAPTCEKAIAISNCSCCSRNWARASSATTWRNCACERSLARSRWSRSYSATWSVASLTRIAIAPASVGSAESSGVVLMRQ